MNTLALSIPAAVSASGIGRTSIYKAIKEGRLPIRKAGKRTLILFDDLQAFLSSLPQGNPVPQPLRTKKES